MDIFQLVPADSIASAYGGALVAAYRSAPFITQCEREFHMNNSEAAQIAQHYGVPGQPSYVSRDSFLG